MNTSATPADHDGTKGNRAVVAPMPPSSRRSSRMSVHFLAHPRFLMAATFVWPTVSMHFTR
ncbi:hypothetical protein [Xylophilus ampelinus]|uniref:Uncharacterized protein n=1 Tax=Xylophilus ampelinus TaxID=54067 RepID=A0A318SKE7_9BURK|nr:hypothetical protein [Xylophilus ampelinus]MCS4508928.1 hypothetical protein [Xylophilus ampelinus]PYE79494.1 hypothetical protein DFQ15_102228 [Xylophilus ampelinus]